MPVPPYVARWSGRELLRYDYEVVRLWSVPQSRVLETSHYTLWPLAGLMEGVTPETTLDVAERIARAPLPLEDRRELTGHLALLAGRRLSPSLVQELLRRNGMLEELLRQSSVAELLRQEGRQEGARATVQTVLEGRFGSLPSSVMEALSRADEATLRGLALHAATDSLDEVARRLGLA